MGRACGHIEGTWIDEELTALFPVEGGHFWESEVVANPDSNVTEGCFDCGKGGARGECLWLLERYFPWNVNVKEMNLSVTPEKLSQWTPNGARVVETLIVLPKLGNWAADDVDIVLLGGLRESFTARASWDALCVLAKIICTSTSIL